MARVGRVDQKIHQTPMLKVRYFQKGDHDSGSWMLSEGLVLPLQH